jgi:hypothetical protein
MAKQNGHGSRGPFPQVFNPGDVVTAPLSDPPPYEAGARVEVDHGIDGWFSGVITACVQRGGAWVFSIDFDDGEQASEDVYPSDMRVELEALKEAAPATAPLLVPLLKKRKFEPSMNDAEAKADADADASMHAGLSCCACGGSHETECCPHFKNVRGKHPDCQMAKVKADADADASGDNSIVETLSFGLAIKQPGDNSCLFHCLAYGMGDGSTASSIRKEVSCNLSPLLCSLVSCSWLVCCAHIDEPIPPHRHPLV